MLRTAEEILDEHLSSLAWDGANPELQAMELRAIDAINQAVRECIIECGSQITQEGTPIRTREKILNLLNQLK